MLEETGSVGVVVTAPWKREAPGAASSVRGEARDRGHHARAARRGAVDAQRAARGLDAVAERHQPASGAFVRAADAVVGDLDAQLAWRRHGADRDRRRPRVAL